jgi:hypothetical protein
MAVNERRPMPQWVTQKAHFALNLTTVFRKHDMNANDVGTRPVRAGAEEKIVLQPLETAARVNPEANGGQPPQKVKEMRSGQFRYAMPSALREVHVLNALAVDMYVENVR